MYIGICYHRYLSYQLTYHAWEPHICLRLHIYIYIAPQPYRKGWFGVKIRYVVRKSAWCEKLLWKMPYKYNIRFGDYDSWNQANIGTKLNINCLSSKCRKQYIQYIKFFLPICWSLYGSLFHFPVVSSINDQCRKCQNKKVRLAFDLS